MTLLPRSRGEPGQLKLTALPDLRSLIVISDQAPAGMFRFKDVAGMAPDNAAEQLAARASAAQPDDAINIQFTSGTTGLPKGATLTHFNVLNNGLFCRPAMEFTDEDCLCIPVPLYHCFGMVLSVMASVLHGAKMVFPSEAFEAARGARGGSEERCTALHGVPTMFIAELEEPDFGQFDLSSLRTGIMAGAPCPVEVMRKVISDMNMEQVTICYGMTETSPVSFQSRDGRSAGETRRHRRAGSSARTGQDHRRKRRGGAAWHFRRTMHPGLLRDAGLLGR